jgi:hypothetical protein
MRRMRGLTSLPRELIAGEDSSPSPHETMAEMGTKGGKYAAATVAEERCRGSRGRGRRRLNRHPFFSS